MSSDASSEPQVALPLGCRAWLETLSREPGSRRPRGSVGHICMQRGLTEWLCTVISTDEVVPYGEGLRRWSNPLKLQRQALIGPGEVLTAAGKRVLAENGLKLASRTELQQR